MKTVRKNRQVRKTKTRRHRMRSQKKVVGGVNWKFWEKSKSTDDPAAPAAAAPTAAADSAPSAPAPAPAPEPVPQCPPCPVCDSTVHLPADQMPAAAAAAQSGGRRRRSRKSRNATKKMWYQLGCKSF